ncbi:MAG: OmpA family protein [Hyphomicrobium sp.]
MRCNPWRWLWGLIPIAMLSWITFNWERGNIEADLATRTREALSRNGLDWAVTTFSGRDVILRGQATEEDQPKAALESVRKVWGVRIVEPRTDLVPKASVFTWLATLNGGKLVLSGLVPSEQARASLLSVARANFPKLQIEDAMRLARGGPGTDVWLSGAGFGLKQLSHLKRGTAGLTDASLALEGEALDNAAFKSVRTALGKLPAKIKLSSDGVMPAVASPFGWSAKRVHDKLVIAGHVSDEEARENLFALAKSKFGSIAIVDRMEVAGGAPDGWAKAASVALEQLARLAEGSAETSGPAFKIAGEAADEATALAIRKSLGGQIPATFQVSDAIKFPEPPPPAEEPAAVEPPPAAAIEPPPAASDEPPPAAFDEPPPAAAVDYDALWREAEARWEKMESERPQTATPADDGEAWWLIAQRDLATRQAALEAELVAAEERRRADERAAEEAARKAAVAAEEARAAKEIEARRAAEAAEAAARKTVDPVRKAEADKCQVLLSAAVKKGNILFKFASADLDSKSTPTLNELAKIAAACPKARIEIEGHTDTTGDESSNKELSQKRAQAIVTYLANAGIDTARMTAAGYGESRPVAPNTTPENMAKNRRIEFSVVPN